MKSLRLFLSLAQLVLPSASFCQEFTQENFSFEQQKSGAAVFLVKQEQVLKEVQQLALKLEDARDAIILKLSAQKIAEYKMVLALPQSNRLEKLRRSRLLAEFSDLDSERALNADEPYLIELGNSIYERRVIRGERIEEFEVAIAGVGRAEPTSIDGRIYTRIVHEGTGAKFLIVDQELDLESKHLKQYIARVNTLANLGKGRPLVLLIFGHTNIDPMSASTGTVRYRYYPKPTDRAQKLKAWWRANYVAPTKGAALLTVMSVLFSAGFTEGVEGVKYLMNHSYVWSHHATALTAMYGTVFGLWGSFYNNITSARDPLNPKSRRNATALRMLVSSATFAYSMQVMNHGISSLTVMTNAGWLNHGRIWMNNIANNMVKDQFKKFNDLREDMGLSRGNVKVLGVNIKRNQFERQIWYQPPNMLKILDLTGFSVGGLPMGSLAFYSSYVWTQYLLYRYAEKLNYSKKDLIRAKWNSMRNAIVSLPQKSLTPILAAAVKYGRYSVLSAQELLATRGAFLKEGWDLLQGDLKACNQFFNASGADSQTQSSLEDSGFGLGSQEWIELKI